VGVSAVTVKKLRGFFILYLATKGSFMIIHK